MVPGGLAGGRGRCVFWVWACGDPDDERPFHFLPMKTPRAMPSRAENIVKRTIWEVFHFPGGDLMACSFSPRSSSSRLSPDAFFRRLVNLRVLVEYLAVLPVS